MVRNLLALIHRGPKKGSTEIAHSGTKCGPTRHAGDGATAAPLTRLWLFWRILPAKESLVPAPRLMPTVGR